MDSFVNCWVTVPLNTNIPENMEDQVPPRSCTARAEYYTNITDEYTWK